MFNSSASSSASANAVSKNVSTGIAQKSHPKSFFSRMHINSELSKVVFDINPSYGKTDDYPRKDIKIIVLQVMLISADYLIVEIVKEEDYFTE